MLENISIHKILFLDVETVPVAPTFSELSEEFQLLWAEKTRWQRSEGQTPDEFYGLKAGVMAEFAKVICVSVGYICEKNKTSFLGLNPFYGDDEELLLNDLKTLLDDKFATKSHYLCAHNGKEFDYPFLCRRMIINGVTLPKILEIAGKKTVGSSSPRHYGAVGSLGITNTTPLSNCWRHYLTYQHLKMILTVVK